MVSLIEAYLLRQSFLFFSLKNTIKCKFTKRSADEYLVQDSLLMTVVDGIYFLRG